MGRGEVTGRLVVAFAALAGSVVAVAPTALAEDELPRPDPPDATTWYTPVVPARLLDTRSDATTIDGLGRPGQRLGEGRSIEVQVVGRGGVPATDVSAVVLNVTAVSPDRPSFITVWPTGAARPEASNLNVVPGQIVPNSVVAKLGTAGNVSLYNHAGSTDVVVDVTGYFPSDDAFVPLVPARVLETRPTLQTVDGLGHEMKPVGSGSAISIDVTGRAGVPDSGVDTVVLNITTVNPTENSFLTVWPTGTERPTSSNLNFARGETVPNLVLAKVGSGGSVSIFNHAGTVDVVADIAGYFPTDSSYVGLRPQRLLDTRDPRVGGDSNPIGRLVPSLPTAVTVAGQAGVPARGVSAVVLNVTAVDAQYDTFLTVWPSGTDRPVASNLNLKAGQPARANLVVAKLGWSGRINLYAHQSGVDVVIDVIGYLLDEPSPVRSMATAYNSTCMVDWLGRVWCSGLITPEMGPVFGPLQDHPRELRRFPSIGDAVDVAVSTFGTICIVRADGTVWCWGPTGLLPPASNHMPWPPSKVPGISNVVDLEISTRQACALDVSGDVWCWGTRFDDVMIDVPTRVQGLGVTTQISVGDWVTCALQQEGSVACWGGQAGFGVLGDGSLNSSTTPLWVAGLDDADSIWSNDWRACATRESGGAVCWGHQYLGTDLVVTAPTPVDVLDGNTGLPADDVWQMSGGWAYGCAVRFDDNVYCWGAAGAGGFGLAPDSNQETWAPRSPVSGLPPVDFIATGPEHMCAVTFESAVYCWGHNFSGQVADGTTTDRPEPTLVYVPGA